MARPREFDVNIHLKMKRDRYRRVQVFAQLHGMSVAEAIRELTDAQLNQLERSGFSDNA